MDKSARVSIGLEKSKLYWTTARRPAEFAAGEDMAVPWCGRVVACHRKATPKLGNRPACPAVYLMLPLGVDGKTMSRSDLAGYPTKDTLFESQTEAITSYMDYLQSRLSELTKRLLTMRELRATLASVKKK